MEGIYLIYPFFSYDFPQVTSQLTIRNVFYRDKGGYRCVATNTLVGEVQQRSATSAVAQLTVTREYSCGGCSWGRGGRERIEGGGKS